jgi:hypothetical protein
MHREFRVFRQAQFQRVSGRHQTQSRGFYEVDNEASNLREPVISDYLMRFRRPTLLSVYVSLLMLVSLQFQFYCNGSQFRGLRSKLSHCTVG